MRLNLREIIHAWRQPPLPVPTGFERGGFFGEHPIPWPVTVTGHVKTWRMCWSWKGKLGLCWTKPVTGA